MLEKRRARAEYEEEDYNELWRTLPAGIEPPAAPPIQDPDEDFGGDMKLPEENLLYFLEKYSPALKAWQREMLRIVRNLAQYFYPQRQTKVMNEGCATFVHYTIMNLLYDRGLITEGSLLEFLHSHTSRRVPAGIRRPPLFRHQSLCAGLCDDERHPPHLPKIRPTRIAIGSRQLAGSGDWHGRAEGCLGELSRRKLHRAVSVAQADARFPAVRALRQGGRRRLQGFSHPQRERLSPRAQHCLPANTTSSASDANIQVIGADLKGDRTLFLEHRMHRGVPLHLGTKEQVVGHIEKLWGHDVVLEEVAD